MATSEQQSPKPTIRVVRFYKMDHLDDPILRRGHIRLGVQGCKGPLRAGIKERDLERRDNLILAIGGITARDGLRDRLVWAGIAVARRQDGSIDCDDGFFLLDKGPLTWRARFPLIARFVDTVTQNYRLGHVVRYPGERAGSISPTLCQEFIRLFEWGRTAAAASQPPSRRGRSGTCPPPTHREARSSRPRGSCGSRRAKKRVC